MILDKKARISILLIFLAVAIFFLFPILAENSTGNENYSNTILLDQTSIITIQPINLNINVTNNNNNNIDGTGSSPGETPTLTILPDTSADQNARPEENSNLEILPLPPENSSETAPVEINATPITVPETTPKIVPEPVPETIPETIPEITLNTTINTTPKIIPNTTTTIIPPVQPSMLGKRGNLLDYSIEKEGESTFLFPNMLIDQLEFISLAGKPLLFELGRTETAEKTFITTFVIDTSSASFVKGSFTKRVEGKELYICTSWNDGCYSGWVKAQDLSGEEYSFSVQPGVVAYGETIAPHTTTQTIGISSDLGILSAVTPTQADGLIVYGELNIALPRYRTWNSTQNFTIEQNAQSIGTGGTNDITWVIPRANFKRDEIIMGTEDKSNDVNIQMFYPSNNSWNNLELIQNKVVYFQ